jgi:hypothetical protein
MGLGFPLRECGKAVFSGPDWLFSSIESLRYQYAGGRLICGER